MKRSLLLFGTIVCSLSAAAQLTVQSGATLFIQSGATVTVQGDITSNANIQGSGTLQLKGSSAQNINMNGNAVDPNIVIDNGNHVTLTGAATANGLLTFTNGKLIIGNFNLTLGNASSFAGTGTSKFVETNGTGQVLRQVNANGTYTLPIGTGTSYTPLAYTLTGSTLSAATVSGRVVAGAHPGKHPRSTDFLNNYWIAGTTGVSGGTVTATGTYNDIVGTGLTGNEASLRGMIWNGSAWSLNSASQDNTLNTVSAPLSSSSAQLYGMNRFVLATPQVFLQAAYNTSNGLMNDLLRNNAGSYTIGQLPPSNLIPLNDPYRNAPYNTANQFLHVNNTDAESISSTVLQDQTLEANNIVDWVFVELRTISSPSVAPVVQTRSALLRRNGTIVDVDGTSPVYFKDVDAGNYILSVRHRNHLGISMDPSAPLSLGLSNSSFNFTTAADPVLFGTAGVNYFTATGVNLMWAGNNNQTTTAATGRVTYTGIGNDKDLILTDITTNGTGAGYFRSDLNMNRSIRYSGIGNDKDYLLSTVLGSSTGTTRLAALPN